MTVRQARIRDDGAAVYCPVCNAKFGGMVQCPWDGAKLPPLPNADPLAVAFYASIEPERGW